MHSIIQNLEFKIYVV